MLERLLIGTLIVWVLWARFWVIYTEVREVVRTRVRQCFRPTVSRTKVDPLTIGDNLSE